MAQFESGNVGLAHHFVISVHLSTEPYIVKNKKAPHSVSHTARGARLEEEGQHSPCVCGFFTSISRKLSGTLYISSICNKRKESGKPGSRRSPFGEIEFASKGSLRSAVDHLVYGAHRISCCERTGTGSSLRKTAKPLDETNVTLLEL